MSLNMKIKIISKQKNLVKFKWEFILTQIYRITTPFSFITYVQSCILDGILKLLIFCVHFKEFWKIFFDILKYKENTRATLVHFAVAGSQSEYCRLRRKMSGKQSILSRSKIVHNIHFWPFFNANGKRRIRQIKFTCR